MHGANTIITTARAIGREDGLRVRVAGADPIEAEFAGWDPATGIAVLRTPGAIGVAGPSIADSEPRPGQIVLALARSWSNAVTASAGIVAIVGGPLRTGRRRQIPRVIRVTAPMHDGFAGGALYDASGRLTGLATAAAIRGFGVAIPASIAWASAARILTAGTPRRGFVGLALQSVELPPAQRPDGRERALLVLAVTPGSPADAAGLIVGDVLHRLRRPADRVAGRSPGSADREPGRQDGRRAHAARRRASRGADRRRRTAEGLTAFAKATASLAVAPPRAARGAEADRDAAGAGCVLSSDARRSRWAAGTPAAAACAAS